MSAPLPPLLPLAISLGDPAGVGPELIAAAWAMRDAEGLPPFFAVGSRAVIEAAARSRGLDIPVQSIGGPDEAAAVFPHALPVLDVGTCDYTPGAPDDAGAELALRSLETATGLVKQGGAAALVTGPIAKSRLARIGFSQPGQTEFVAEACGITPENAVMMLAGLNPHAGEDGRMRTEDGDLIAPAVALLREAGIDARGPLPADTMFHAEARATYDAAICMYHDQALIPIKVLDFDEGVNVTLGLPIVRTSPDHGTAFGIAGQGTARPGATVAAIRMAGECAARRAANG